ncbi:flavin reductase family protein [Mycolicibacterium elephantis]
MHDVRGSEELREVFGCFPSGVVAVCALVDGDLYGISASSFTAVSLDPPLVSVCIAKTSNTWPVLRKARIGVSVLATRHSVDCRRLAARSDDKFADIEVATTQDGSVFIAGSSAWLDCSFEREVAAGDHVIAILRVHRVHVASVDSPLVFYRSKFHRISELGE